MQKAIELAHIVPISEVNGPGKRTVIWVQGCPKRCKECWNPEFLKFGSNWTLSPDELFSHVREVTCEFSAIEGLTFSGGEPFAQAEFLSKAARLFRKENLTLMSYSGYSLDEIRKTGTPLTDFLNQLDILVDGEYVRELQSFKLWRSSSNQQVHFLTDRYAAYKEKMDSNGQEIELTLSNAKMNLTGFPDLSFLKKLRI